MTTDPNPSPEAPQAPRPLAVTLMLWTSKLAVAVILGVAGWLKLNGNQADIDLFTELEMEPMGRYVIGALELAVAAMVLLRQSAVYGAFLGFGVMCGAILGELTALEEFHHIGLAIVVALLCLVILYIRRRDAPFIGNLIDW